MPAHRRKVLFVSSNHLSVRPGGLESYTQDLYEGFQRSRDFEPVYLARAGAPFTGDESPHGSSPFVMAAGDPNQYLLYTDSLAAPHPYDALFGRRPAKQVLTRYFSDFLRAHEPDIVHFHHVNFFGYDILRVTRNVLPDVPIAFTLHEYLAICHRDGQMVRTQSNDLCQEESPRCCHECFPEVPAQSFAMRKRFIQSHLDLVDLFIAPSDYVGDRYLEWGLPARKLVVEPQGKVPVTERVPEAPRERRNRFAFFGTLNPYKGADVLLEAMAVLGEDFDGHLWIFGANLEIQEKRFRESLQTQLDAGRITFAGPYEQADLGRLMAQIDWVVVPSIWWETGPMVVIEAFEHGRPVICSNIGGMSEKVTDGVNGLHFRRADADHLAEVMRRAAQASGLWDRLQAGIPPDPPRTMDDHVQVLSGLYEQLLAERARPSAGHGRPEQVARA